jgi:hypothetical protein
MVIKYDLLKKDMTVLKGSYSPSEETDAIETRIFGGKSGGCLWFSKMRDTLLSSDYVDYLFEKPTDILKLVG